MAAEAKALEEKGEWVRAREEWLKALALLPADARQAAWIREHADRLGTPARPAASSPEVAGGWLVRLAPAAPVLVALTKGKALLALFNMKFLASLGVFLGVYWSVYGMSFGLGFTAQILIHELGHYVDIKRRGLPVDMPVFLPGLGAFVRWQALGVSLQTRAAVSLAGPLAGWFAAAVCAIVWLHTGDGLWAALARTGAWLNVLNLIPVWALDGGQEFLALKKAERGVVLAVCLALLLLLGEGVFLLVALGAGYRLFTKDLPKSGSPSSLAYFVVLLAAFALLKWIVPGVAFGPH